MTMEPFGLDSTTVLVTGGGSGIGEAIARAAHSAGADVAIVGRRREPLEMLHADLGIRCHVLHGDVTDPAFVRDLPNRLPSDLPTLRGFVHCAGNHVKRPFLEGSAAEDASVFDIHLRAAMELSRTLLPLMVEAGGGSVIFISSMAARLGVPSVPAYSAAKGGLVSLARALAAEMGGKNVRVNVVTPGWIDTDMTQRALEGDRGRQEAIFRRTPLGRLGEPEDIGHAAVYLLSRAAKFVTGADLTVDGGASTGF
jgi:NAD(P)-dependent dehydrogenase (short-subunit alcohol dehydrogenase family)